MDLVRSSENIMQGSPEWLKILDSAIALNPNNEAAWRERSVWATKTGDYVEAYHYLNKAVEKDPAAALGYRGWLKLYKLHDYQGALDDFERLDALTPDYTDYPWSENIHYVKALALCGLGRLDDARTEFNRCINGVTKSQGENWVDIYAFIDRGICYRELNMLDSAIFSLEKAIKYFPESPEAHFHKGLTLTNMQRTQEACDEFRLSLQLANERRIRTDPYRDHINQLYIEDIQEALDNCR